MPDPPSPLLFWLFYLCVVPVVGVRSVSLRILPLELIGFALRGPCRSRTWSHATRRRPMSPFWFVWRLSVYTLAGSKMLGLLARSKEFGRARAPRIQRPHLQRSSRSNRAFGNDDVYPHYSACLSLALGSGRCWILLCLLEEVVVLSKGLSPEQLPMSP